MRCSRIQLETARYVRIQLDTVEYIKKQWIRCKLAIDIDRYRACVQGYTGYQIYGDIQAENR